MLKAGTAVMRRHKTAASLYVHWPYCNRLCPYCDFVKAANRNVDHKRMNQALCTELKTLLKEANVEKILSVYFGGGTPSLAQPTMVEDVLAILKQSSSVEFDPECEVTLECNPTRLEASKLVDFKNAGVNRVSVGVQSLNDHMLKKILLRDHGAEEALRTIDMAETLFPRRVSLELMFGLPHQTLDMWLQELHQVTTLPAAPSHISIYQLTIEKGTAFSKWKISGKLHPPTSDITDEMFIGGTQFLEKSGFHRYEIANFARSIDARAQHNLHTWRGGSYLGIGPGAHGRYSLRNDEGRLKAVNIADVAAWLGSVEQCGRGTQTRERLTHQEAREEALILGFRTLDGVRAGDLVTLQQLQMLRQVPELQRFIDHKQLEIDENGIRPSKTGLHIADSLLTSVCYHLDRENLKSQRMHAGR